MVKGCDGVDQIVGWAQRFFAIPNKHLGIINGQATGQA
jgi:hypothetical protein